MPDFLDDIIKERTKETPSFPALVQAEDRRQLLRGPAAERERSGHTQTEVAAAMGTSQSHVARLEAANPRDAPVT